MIIAIALTIIFTFTPILALWKFLKIKERKWMGIVEHQKATFNKLKEDREKLEERATKIEERQNKILTKLSEFERK